MDRNARRPVGSWAAAFNQGEIMLVLSRKRNEVIRIGEDITVVVAEIRGDKVRLGIVAPDDIAVHRQEVYDSIQRDDPAASVKSLAKLEENERKTT